MIKATFKQYILLSVLFSLLRIPILEAQTYVKTRIILTEGGDLKLRQIIARNLTTVIREINKVAKGIGNLDNIRYFCTETGHSAICRLAVSDKIYAIMPVYRTKLVKILPTEFFEVRGIRVNIGNRPRDEEPKTEYLVFSIEPAHQLNLAGNYGRL